MHRWTGMDRDGQGLALMIYGLLWGSAHWRRTQFVIAIGICICQQFSTSLREARTTSENVGLHCNLKASASLCLTLHMLMTNLKKPRVERSRTKPNRSDTISLDSNVRVLVVESRWANISGITRTERFLFIIFGPKLWMTAMIGLNDSTENGRNRKRLWRALLAITRLTAILILYFISSDGRIAVYNRCDVNRETVDIPTHFDLLNAQWLLVKIFI